MKADEFKAIKNIFDALNVVVNSSIGHLPIEVEVCSGWEDDQPGRVDLVLPMVPLGGPLTFAEVYDKRVEYFPAKPGEYLPNNTIIGHKIFSGEYPKAYTDLLEIVKTEFKKAGYKVEPMKITLAQKG